MQRTWTTITALWLLGVLAAAQLAKFSTIAPVLRARFDLSLPATGWLISLLEVGGGLFGFFAGIALCRITCRRSLLSGLFLLAGMSVVEAMATGTTTLFSARAVEGIGYLLVVIAAPTAIAAVADDRNRPRALALWSSFVPVGIAVGSAITGLAVSMVAVRGTMLLWAGLLAAAAVVGARLPIADGANRRIVLPAPAACVSTFAFGVYTLFLCALTMLLPTFLIEKTGASLDEAGLVASFVSLTALPASGLAILALRRVGLSSRRLVSITMPALAGTALLSSMAFGGATNFVWTSGFVLAAVFLGGLVSPLMFARLPTLAGAESAQDPRIATANGLLTQFGAGGALVGPPLGGVVVSWWGWKMLGIAVAAMAMAMLCLVMLSEWIGERNPQPDDAR